MLDTKPATPTATPTTARPAALPRTSIADSDTPPNTPARSAKRRRPGWTSSRSHARRADLIANQAEMTTIGGPSATVAATTSHPSGCPNMLVSLCGSESSQGLIQKRPIAYNTVKGSRAPPAAPTAAKTREPVAEFVRFSNGRLTSCHRLRMVKLKSYARRRAVAMISLPLAYEADVPGVVGHLFPMRLPTERWTPSMAYGFQAPRVVDRYAWKAYDLFGKLAFPEAEINDLRRRSGMPTRDWLRFRRTEMRSKPCCSHRLS